jgi:hypothetical protein
VSEVIALAGCGGQKAAAACRADRMYTGQYSRACWEAAVAVASCRAYFISARYGLVPRYQVIEPYDLKMGGPDSVDAVYVARQAVKLGVRDAAVIVLAGQAYADLAREVWDDVRTPLAGLGIGRQLHELAVITALGAVASG